MSKGDKDYNDVFERLVSDEADIVGHIAYALYKSEKQEWIKNKKDKGENNIDLSGFVELQTDKRLEYYRLRADMIINKFAGEVASNALQEEHDKLEAEYRLRYESLAKKCEPKGWFYGFWQGFASSFAITLLLGFILLIIILNNGGILAIGEALVKFARP
ncbi:MAG: hypothetical protein Q4D58_00685 [Synergistaceae bacterium]|nr:hypothetical protein [Synergistaceae bacterium]